MKHFLLPLLLAPGVLLAQQPNILLIMADDVDVEAFQAYATNPVNTTGSSGAIATPNIDALAAQGLRFTNAFTTPLCTPTRCMLLTGQSNRRNYRAFGYLDNDQTTFAQVLRTNGYTTAVAGKWQLSDPDGDTPITPSGAIAPNVTPAVMRDDYGFDSYLLWQLNHTQSDKGSRYWDPKLETASGDGLSSVLVSTAPGDYGPDLFAQHLKDFMTDAAASSTPFLAYYAMALPHDPWVSTPDAPGATTGDDEQYFDENIEYIDTLVGELVAHLDDPDGNPGTSDSIRGNTIIIFTSDNGTSPRITVNNSERGNVTGDKGTATYDGTHVPFILDWGSKTPASVESRMLDLSDVFPTILEVAGITPAPDLVLDGQPIIDATGNVLENKEAATIWYDPKGRNFPTAEFAQNQTYKLYKDGRFFNIATDKLETTNLNDGSLTTEEQTNFDALDAVLSAWDPPAPEAGVLFSDNFESETVGTDYPDATNNTTQGDGVSATGGWTEIESSGNEATVVNDSLLGNSMSLIENNWRPSVAAGFAGVTLATGDTLTLSFDFNVVSGTENGGYVRFGFWNTTDLGGHGTGTSYWAKVSTSSTAADAGLFESTSPGANFTAIDSTGTAGTGGVSFNTEYSVNFSLTGTPAGIDLFYEILDSSNNTVAFLSGNDTSFDTFNAIGFRINETADSGSDTVIIDNVVVNFTPDLTPAEAWRLFWFDQIENSGDAADTFDFDKDGLVNLLERAFGSDPTTPRVAGILPASSTVDTAGNPGSDYLALSYRRLPGGTGTTGIDYTRDGITWTVQYDNDLADPWNTGDITVLFIADNADGTESVRVRLNEPVATPGKQFIRLNVSEIP